LRPTQLLHIRRIHRVSAVQSEFILYVKFTLWNLLYEIYVVWLKNKNFNMIVSFIFKFL
jgi:hypothetical protein